MGFPGGSEGKESACNAGRPGFDPWVGKIPWRRKWQSTPVCLPGEFHGQIPMLIHVDVWQKPIQYCKAIILQLKKNKFQKSKNKIICQVFFFFMFSARI